jgi:hypothetical protein
MLRRKDDFEVNLSKQSDRRIQVELSVQSLRTFALVMLVKLLFHQPPSISLAVAREKHLCMRLIRSSTA